jgi:c-di-AMP phosphodiesterase-like protein
MREHEMLLRPGTTREDVMKVINKYYKEDWEEMVALENAMRLLGKRASVEKIERVLGPLLGW